METKTLTISKLIDILSENGHFYYDNKKIMLGSDLVVMDFKDFTAFDGCNNFDEDKDINTTEIEKDQIAEIANYFLKLVENQDKPNDDNTYLRAGAILLNAYMIDETWTLKEINMEIEFFYENLKKIASILQEYFIDKQKCKDYLFDLFEEFEDYDPIKDRLRSLNSNGDLTDAEYDFCMAEYEDILNEWLNATLR